MSRYEMSPTKTLGINVTNDGARELAYIIVKATNKRETVLAEFADKDHAKKVLQTMKHEMRSDLTIHNKSKKYDLILKQVRMVGKQLNRDSKKATIRWEQVHEINLKTIPIRRYASKRYAKRVMGL